MPICTSGERLLVFAVGSVWREQAGNKKQSKTMTTVSSPRQSRVNLSCVFEFKSPVPQVGKNRSAKITRTFSEARLLFRVISWMGFIWAPLPYQSIWWHLEY